MTMLTKKGDALPRAANQTSFQPASREEAEEAVRTILRFIGEDPNRPGLMDTPGRVIRAWEEWCHGYKENAEATLDTYFEDIRDYDQPVVMRNIDFVSHCEHHMAPMPGKAHIAYWPAEKIVGISKLARIVDVFAKRLQSQENLTREIAEALHAALLPKGVAVVIEAAHGCMTTRGVMKSDSTLNTRFFTGCFKSDLHLQEQILSTLQA
ncbi:MAG TPA: GTP cyclohydrolase I FolE [Alphaproteobacteria bacterium]|nr:GTP cyclohydrolase I FolE [Alphaproteobacteria bacterium]